MRGSVGVKWRDQLGQGSELARCCVVLVSTWYGVSRSLLLRHSDDELDWSGGEEAGDLSLSASYVHIHEKEHEKERERERERARWYPRVCVSPKLMHAYICVWIFGASRCIVVFLQAAAARRRVAFPVQAVDCSPCPVKLCRQARHKQPSFVLHGASRKDQTRAESPRQTNTTPPALQE